MDELHAMALEARVLLAIATKWSGRCLEQRLHQSGVPISSMQYGMLRLLRGHRHTISDLSRRMSLAPATLVPAVDALERHGLVERGSDPNDRRRAPLLLTAGGADILARIPAVDDTDVLAVSLAALGDADRHKLLELLRALVGAMPDGAAVVADIARGVREAD